MFEWKKWYIHIWSNQLTYHVGNLIGLGGSARACAFWPFLIVRKDFKNWHDNSIEELINHEKIHLIQQLEMLVIFAEILYILEFLYARYILKLPKKEAYYFISLEQEAHINAPNKNYLNTRKFWALIPYLLHKRRISRNSDGLLVVKEKITEHL